MHGGESSKTTSKFSLEDLGFDRDAEDSEHKINSRDGLEIEQGWESTYQ